MLARIGQAPAFGALPLRSLGTRAPDDAAIALIDAAAGTAHVLGWSLNRLWSDSTIGLTEDRTALAALTALLGHQPRPAISAATTLAFTLDDVSGTTDIVQIPKGMKIASIPGQNELPLTFETDTAIETRVAWDSLSPVRSPVPQVVSTAMTSVIVARLTFPARVGDSVLIWQSTTQWLWARVTAVLRDAFLSPAQTILTLTAGKFVASGPSLTDPALAGQIILLGQRAQAFGATAPDAELMSTDLITSGKITVTTLTILTITVEITQWAHFKIDPSGTATGGRVFLDAIYPDAAPKHVVMIEASGVPGSPQIGEITAAHDTARTDFGLSAKCSVIEVNGINLTDAAFNTYVRLCQFHIETARATLLIPLDDLTLPLAANPDRITVQGTDAAALSPGRFVVLTAAGGPTERATLLSATAVGPNTELVFDAALANTWPASALSVLANAVAASHGETPASGTEVLGSGIPSAPLQRFTLKSAPLAHVAAPGAKGYAEAIEVRVADRLYDPVDTLFAAPPLARLYTLTTAADGRADVQFSGRLPSGAGNVTALYRKGGGAAGNLGAGRLTAAMTPVLGVKSVSNLLPAEGGSDAETLDDMRLSAPKSIRTLDRAVSLQDFEAFAIGYRGVGKALASELYAGMRREVCLTIATTTLEPAIDGSPLITDLRTALLAAAPPGTALRIVAFTDIAVSVTIALAIDPGFRRADVEAAIRARLAADFGRSVRPFGTGLHRSQILASVQSVAGTVAALLTSFSAASGTIVEDAQGRLRCPGPEINPNSLIFTEAGLMALSGEAITFAELAP